MGNCCSSEAETIKAPQTSYGTPQQAGNVVTQSNVASTRPATAEEDRIARLEAAQRRAQEQQGRGVSGGKLSQQLAEQQKIKPGAIPYDSKDAGNMTVADWN